MSKQKEGPVRVADLMEQFHIQEEDIVCVAKTDMDRQGRFVPGMLILTSQYLIAGRAMSAQHSMTISGGNLMAPKRKGAGKPAADEMPGNYVGECYPLTEIKALVASFQLRTYTLYSKGDNGAVDRQIAVYTAGCQREVQELIQALDRCKHPEKSPIHLQKRPERAGEDGPTAGLERVERGPQKSRKHMFLRIASYFKPYLGLMVLLLLVYLASAGLNLLWPYLNGTILYDRVFSCNSAFLEWLHLPAAKITTALLLIVVIMVLTKLTMLLCEILQGVVLAKLVPQVVLAIKNELFKSMGQLSLGFFQSSQTGGLMTRVLSDADVVVDFFSTWLPNILTDCFTLITTCIVMFAMDWRLALASWLLLPLLALITIKLRSRLHTLFGCRHRAERSLQSKLNDNITGVRVVKAFGQEQKEIEKFGGTNRNVKDVEMSIVGYNNRFTSLYTFVQEAVTLMVWAVGAYFVLVKGEITYGVLITFAGYVSQLQQPLRDFSQMFRSFSECVSAAERIFEVLDAKPEITQRENPVSIEQLKGEITISNVTFGYEPNYPVLHDLSLHVPAGQTLGIVGRSGAGKSTLVNLISRLYEVWEGSIRIDGVDIRDLSFRDLRKNVAMVSQDTYIFMGTVAENIAYSNPEASKEDVIRAAKLASAHDFICKMPEGYDTIIGASGRTLSGGERQRISIARAILADPKILILDEATASVDTETEKAIQKSIQYLSKNRTTISIAHRLSTLRDADHLIVIEHGRIVEEGTHRELIEKKGTFYLLMELQTKALAMRGLVDEE